MKSYVRVSILFILCLTLLLGIVSNVSGAQTASITKIYGSETQAIDCKGFTEFYEGNMFVWFQMDTSVDAKASYQAINQQALGDMTIKNAVNSKIKLGGLTIKQINAGDGNPYSAMLAFEEANGKLRISVWLSWGGETVQSLFEKEVKEKFTVEILEGFVVPSKNYSLAKPEYVNIKPIKYEISLDGLEFKQDKTNSKYSADKDSWMKPMFEELNAQWKVAGGKDKEPTPGDKDKEPAPGGKDKEPTPGDKDKEPAPSDKDKEPAPGGKDKEPAPDSGDNDTEEPNGENNDTEEPNGDNDTEEPNGENNDTEEPDGDNDTEEPDKDTSVVPAKKSPIVPIIIGIIGIAVIGAGIFLFLKKQPEVSNK